MEPSPSLPAAPRKTHLEGLKSGKKSEGKHQQLRQISLYYPSEVAFYSFVIFLKCSFFCLVFLFICLISLFDWFSLFSLSYYIFIFLLSLHSYSNNTLLLVFSFYSFYSHYMFLVYSHTTVSIPRLYVFIILLLFQIPHSILP